MTGFMGFCFALTGIGTAASALLHFTVRTRRGKAVLMIVHAAAVLIGAVCLAASAVMAHGAAGGTADQLAWASDAYGLWMRAGGIFTAVIGGVLTLAALIRHKMVKIRAAAGCAATLLLLFFGGCCGVICIGEAVDPSVWVWTSALGYAGLMQLGGTVDAAFALFAKK